MFDKHNFDPSLRILVVDDQVFMRNMLKAILKGLGIQEIDSAEDGIGAIQLIGTTVYDVIICDWNMPHLNGLEFLQRVRGLQAYDNTPFIMLTAEAYRENVSEALKAGVSDYIAKPFTSDVLAEKLSKVLARRKKSAKER